MRVPTKHGLDRKFKPWRKGKSANSNKRSSLKQQLRGHERLLSKILKSAENKDGADETRTKELKSKIAALKIEISQKQQSMVEKKHAEKAHGQRFLDRQRLTREEKKVRKSNGADQEQQLLKLALDKVYVAHHPNDVKYMPLFKHGKRVTDQSRQLFRRAVTRKRILRDINKVTRVNWIGSDQYERLPKDEWTIQDEERVFGGSVSRSNKEKTGSVTKTEDSRFAMASNHEELLRAAAEAESDLLQQDDHTAKPGTSGSAEPEKGVTEKNDSSSSDDDSSDSEDEEVNPLSNTAKTSRNESAAQQKAKEENSSSSSDSDSSDSDSDDDETKTSSSKADTSKRKSASGSSTSDSDSSSDSDSDSSDDEGDDKKQSSGANLQTSTTSSEDEEEEVDDFLVDATGDHDVFKKPAVKVPAMSAYRGDKSKGFDTQSQRPGEYRKKRIRRY
ncbi:unnamed protein product [Pseudo-nitzschia multistriata]|uniref:rRNA-processing protein EFG1 n=1 Tax=Pseudo-nitzschia multistriata TaxID=183589 RepID=A0A448ZSA8_9STRA|nr:unnamed protein product [Pseudo-nitzschia multistriata]